MAPPADDELMAKYRWLAGRGPPERKGVRDQGGSVGMRWAAGRGGVGRAAGIARRSVTAPLDPQMSGAAGKPVRSFVVPHHRRILCVPLLSVGCFMRARHAPTASIDADIENIRQLPASKMPGIRYRSFAMPMLSLGRVCREGLGLPCRPHRRRGILASTA